MSVKRENNIEAKIVFAGRYSEDEIISGPEFAAKKLFEEHCRKTHGCFIQYFFDGRKYSLLKKLFGRKDLQSDNGVIITTGIFRIFSELRKHKPDIIHLTGFERFAVIFFLYRVLFSVKIVYSSHGIIRHENEKIKKITGFTAFKDKLCEKIFLNYSDAIVFPSLAAKETALQYYSFRSEKINIIPNGVEEIFTKNIRAKGTNGYLKAVMMYKNTLNTSGRDTLLKLPGLNELPVKIFYISESEINAANEKFHNVKPMPHKKLAEFYADKDIFLSLNSYETFSISTAEAMASGLIPVVTANSGIAGFIKNGINGFVIEDMNSSKLFVILNDLSKMKETELNILRENAANAVKNLKWENIYGMYDEIYRKQVK